MHYGKYASLYLKNTFFFDANPPLGKLVIALAGYISGFDGGTFGFDKIGSSYPEDVPYVVLRLVPAVFGALLTPTVFLILSELQAFAYAGYLASFMVVFGKIESCTYYIDNSNIGYPIILNKFLSTLTVKNVPFRHSIVDPIKIHLARVYDDIFCNDVGAKRP